MIDFMSDLLILTGGLLCVMFWLTLLVMIIIEVSDNIRGKPDKEELDE